MPTTLPVCTRYLRTHAQRSTSKLASACMWSMGGFQKSSQGEGTGMIDFNENKCLCSDVSKVIVCICHNDNTIDKERFKSNDIGVPPMYGQVKEVLTQILNVPNFNLINYSGLKTI